MIFPLLLGQSNDDARWSTSIRVKSAHDEPIKCADGYGCGRWPTPPRRPQGLISRTPKISRQLFYVITIYEQWPRSWFEPLTSWLPSSPNGFAYLHQQMAIGFFGVLFVMNFVFCKLRTSKLNCGALYFYWDPLGSKPSVRTHSEINSSMIFSFQNMKIKIQIFPLPCNWTRDYYIFLRVLQPLVLKLQKISCA